jgi:hypothetical protein
VRTYLHGQSPRLHNYDTHILAVTFNVNGFVFQPEPISKMPSKKAPEENVDALIAEYAKNAPIEGVGNAGLFGLASLFCCVLPGYLFSTPMIGLDLQSNIPVYGAVTLISTVLLTYASQRVANTLFNQERKKLNNSDLEDYAREYSIGKAMFKYNLMYLFFALFMAFWLVPTFTTDSKIRFAASVCSPAVFLAYLSTYSK